MTLKLSFLSLSLSFFFFFLSFFFFFFFFFFFVVGMGGGGGGCLVCLFYVLFSALFVNAQILFLIQTGSVCIREPNRTYVLCT